VLVDEDVERLSGASGWPELAGRFAAAFWPGPLTLVVRGESGEWIGYRRPDHPAAAAVVRAAGGALLASSANRSGDAPAQTARQAAEALGHAAAIAVDGGPARLGVASSVVRVEGCAWELLRQGALTREALSAAAGRPPKGGNP